MKILKNNIKLIIGLIIGAILSGGIVYATSTYLASQVDYNKNGQAKVSNALDDLYSKVPSGEQNITTNGTYDISKKASVIVNVSEINKTLLWTNASPNSELGNGDINMSSSLENFTHILIQWKRKTSDSTVYEDLFNINPKRTNGDQNSGTYTIGCYYESSGLAYRQIRYKNQTTLYTGNACYQDGSFQPSYLIPLYIYGLSFSY